MNFAILLAEAVPAAFKAPASIPRPLWVGGDVIVWATSAASSGVRVCGPLSIRAVWDAAEICTIGRRALCVDEDNYLIINGAHEYATHADRRDTGDSLTIFFSDETQSAHGADRSGRERRDFFAEHLRPHGDAVSQHLQRIRDARRRGVTDNRWYSEQIRMLYAQIVLAEDELHRRSIVFAPASVATRTELLRRVMTATDFVNSNYMSSVTLDDIASAAHLSKYHLARSFRAFHGVSPAAYLRLKRITAAERLIERSNADLADIAERSGFGSRWSMFRELRRRRGMSGQRIRKSWEGALVEGASTAV